MKLTKKSGAVLAASAAVMLLGGTVTAPTAMAVEKGKVKCFGVNKCEGKGECGTSKHDCGGKNKCAGKGWISLTKAECEAKGGKLTES